MTWASGIAVTSAVPSAFDDLARRGGLAQRLCQLVPTSHPLALGKDLAA